jgi:hypothetical protein
MERFTEGEERSQITYRDSYFDRHTGLRSFNLPFAPY